MSLTPTQLSELQTIVETLRTEFPNSDDDLWQAAIRIQKGGLGPVTGTGGQAAFDAAVADIVEEAEQISTVQGQQGGLGQSVDVAVFNVVPIEGELPAGSVGDVIYIDTAPSTYLATDVVSLTPAGPNSVIISEVGTQVARSVPAASGGMEVNNLSTGAGFERVLTTSDMGGSGITIEDEGAPLPGLATTLDFVGAGVTASGAGATKTITIPGAALPSGNVGDIVYISTAPDTYSTTNAIEVDPSDDVIIRHNGELRVATEADGILRISSNDAGSPGGGGAYETQIRFTQVTNLTVGEVGYRGGQSVLDIANSVNSAPVRILGASGGAGADREMALFRPLAEVELYFAGVNVAETLPAASGGLQANNTLTGAGFERVLTASDLPTQVVAGTVDNQGLRWDVGNAQYEAAPEFAIGDTRDAYLGIPLNTGKLIYVGTISNLVDERAHVGFDGSSLEFEVKNLTASSQVTIKGTNSGASEVTFLIANPNSDTLLRGQTGLRLESSSGVIEMEPGGNGFFEFNSAGILDLLGNATQSGVLRITEGTSPFGDVAGRGQLWADSADSRIKWTDDGGTDNTLAYLTDITGASPGGANTAVQFNDSGSFGGSSDFEWDGSQLKIEASQAQLFLDETDGGGAAQLFLTSTTTADSALVIEFDSSTGVDARIRQATSGGTLQDTWITFREDQGVGLRYNDVPKFSTLAEGVLANDSIYIIEKAAANADTATRGQLWMETRPFAQRLMFTPENGADIIVAGLPDSDVSPGSVLISGTGFVAVANIGNVTDTVYMLLINVEVTAPAADDMLIQLTVNTGSRFKGVLTYAGQGITAGSSEIESTTGEVITNNVLVPTSGNSTPDGTYVSIQGVLFADGVAQTVSLRCAKNADTGADGFAVRATIKALPCSNP